MDEITRFFSEVTSKRKKAYFARKDWQDLLFIVSSQFGWTQKELMETDIPYLLDALDGMRRDSKRQEAEMKKSSRKRRK